MPLETSYTSEGAGSSQQGAPEVQAKEGQYWELSKCRKAYTDYLFSKREELDEQIEARRYYHGSQWTAEQIAALKKRKQPIMTFNRVARKIDGVVGLIERLRQDPKAYPRTPQHQQGADLATAVIRYVLDRSDWKAVSPICATDGAVDGIGGLEIKIRQGDQGDPEITFENVDVQAFFYDPRSYKDDFSDATYMGIGKWIDEDIAKETWPNAIWGGGVEHELQSDSDRERRWFSTDGAMNRYRVVDIWYRHRGGWCWAIFNGNEILNEGKAWLKDEQGKDICKFQMFSGNVDQDGDRYGFIRNMKSPQDGINARQSKMQHILASNRLILRPGAVDDVEKVRAEWNRADGVVEVNGPVNESVKVDDRSFDFAGWTKLLELNLAEIENFGPNPALIGQGVENKSGRAIALLQQAGMAELGPYILAFKGWKIRVYRALWNAVQQHWQAERWVRVTDSQDLAQFIQINGLGIDPMTGQPTIINAVGSLDVDVIMDEGDDHLTSMAETYEMLQQIIPAIAPTLSPQEARLYGGLVIETSNLPHEIKQQFKQASQQIAQQPPQPDPAVEAEKMKAQVQLESQAQMGQLKSQQQQNDNQAKMISNAIDIEHKSRLNELDLRANQVKALNDMDMQRQKAETDGQLQRQRADHEMQMMRERNDMQIEHETKKARTRGDQKNLASGHQQHIELLANAISENLGNISQGLQQISSGQDELKNLVTAPKKVTIERDRTGKITGATAKVSA